PFKELLPPPLLLDGGGDFDHQLPNSRLGRVADFKIRQQRFRFLRPTRSKHFLHAAQALGQTALTLSNLDCPADPFQERRGFLTVGSVLKTFQYAPVSIRELVRFEFPSGLRQQRFSALTLFCGGPDLLQQILRLDVTRVEAKHGFECFSCLGILKGLEQVSSRSDQLVTSLARGLHLNFAINSLAEL